MKQFNFTVFLVVVSLIFGVSHAGFCIKSKAGYYLSATSDGTVTSSSTCGDWEQWTVHQVNVFGYEEGRYGFLHDRTYYRTNIEHYLTANSDGSVELIQGARYEIMDEQNWAKDFSSCDSITYAANVPEGDPAYLSVAANGVKVVDSVMGDSEKFY